MTSYQPVLPSAGSVLVASSNDALRRRVIESLHFNTAHVEEASGGADALAKLEDSHCSILMLDRCLVDLDSSEVVKMVGAQHPSVEVVLLDSEGSASLAIAGNHAKCRLADDAAARGHEESIPGLIGSSLAMRRVASMIQRVARRDTTVLLTGETGTGKEVVAQAIHRLGNRASRPFVTVNCAAIPEALLESELFGYVRGAFTGAVQSRVGRIHTAHSGTLFLDEIGEMPIALQAKLLRFLETCEIQRLGSPDIFKVDVRIIAATNANLPVRIAERQFREDLYYRLAVFPIELPPLRQRGDDIVRLAKHFLHTICGQVASFDDKAEQWLTTQPWRGNVRELRHCIERAGVWWDGGEPVTVDHLLPRT